MLTEELQISVAGGKQVTAVLTSPDGWPGEWLLIYAPGAGSKVNDPFGVYAGAMLAERGTSVVRFQFPHMEAGRRGPDRPRVLESTWRSVIETFRHRGPRLVVGGRSMGGRIGGRSPFPPSHLRA